MARGIIARGCNHLCWVCQGGCGVEPFGQLLAELLGEVRQRVRLQPTDVVTALAWSRVAVKVRPLRGAYGQP
jgi:hypothetical protein